MFRAILLPVGAPGANMEIERRRIVLRLPAGGATVERLAGFEATAIANS
ncbi:MAG: hypothetical protein ABSC38_06030 [Verrucomicrobiia bacterium]